MEKVTDFIKKLGVGALSIFLLYSTPVNAGHIKYKDNGVPEVDNSYILEKESIHCLPADGLRDFRVYTRYVPNEDEILLAKQRLEFFGYVVNEGTLKMYFKDLERNARRQYFLFGTFPDDLVIGHLVKFAHRYKGDGNTIDLKLWGFYVMGTSKVKMDLDSNGSFGTKISPGEASPCDYLPPKREISDLDYTVYQIP